jgi:amidase
LNKDNNPEKDGNGQSTSTGHNQGTASGIVAMSALDLSRAIKARNVSCVEVMKAYLSRIEAVNPQHNAIVSLRDQDDLLAEAEQKDGELASGIHQGWMHGFPHAVKDLAAAQGLPTTMGSPLLKDMISPHDDFFVERIKRAGAIIIGKTNTPEFGLGSQTYNHVFGTTLNAYDPKLCAGGSSGGAAVALATRMVPVADGSDMMGSLRNPAAFNNVIGFRPSFGRVPSGPALEIFYSQLAYEGPMARSVRDAAMLLSTMAGFDTRIPLSIREDPLLFSGSLQADMQDKKIAWLGDFNGYLAMEPEILTLCETALDHFENLGCTVESVDIAYPMETLWQTWLTLRHWMVAGVHGPLYASLENRDRLKPEAIWEIEEGLSLKAIDVYNASVERSTWYQTIADLFARFDYLAVPSAQVFPFDANTHWPRKVAGKTMDTYHRWMEVTVPGTLSGCPIANVPVGFNDQGLPMGMQIIGPATQDLKVLQLAHAYEQASGWTRQDPMKNA